MKLMDFLKDKISIIIIELIMMVLIFLVLNVYQSQFLLNIFIVLIIFIGIVITLLLEFTKKANFYNSFEKILLNLDKKYLIVEMLNKANFIESDLLIDYLYEINKSYIEEINKYKYTSEEFKEYIELWCHEIKMPIATSKLILENNQNKKNKSMLEELDKIENYVEQVLYFTRSEIVEKDYMISKLDLKLVIDNIIKKNKNYFIEKKIKIETLDKSIYIESDAKWLEFIINQIITNSIKYTKEDNPKITIICEENKNNTILKIEDNGIGIKKEEISKVFNKGFTGSNGRMKYNSTGIGLYLCHKLCDKLNHKIYLNSDLNERTVVSIVFPKSSMITSIK